MTSPQWGYWDNQSEEIGGEHERVFVKQGPKGDYRLYAVYNFASPSNAHYYRGKLAGKPVNAGWPTEAEAKDFLDRLAVVRGWKEATLL